MSYIGNTNTTQAFTPAIDYFSGNGSTTAFTLSRPVASVAQIQVVVNNVPQNPSTAYTVLNNTLTFTGAPSSGTNNIYVEYTSPITQVIQPGQGTVAATQIVDASITPAKMSAGAPSWSALGGVSLPRIDSVTEGGQLNLNRSSDDANAWGIDVYGSTSTPSLRFVDNVASATRMAIDGSGNVGIGTSSPSYKLDVQAATSVAQVKSTTGTNAAYYVASNTGGDFYIGRENSAGTTFGTTAYSSVLWSAGSYPMAFFTNGNERARIDSSGNLLVGKTAIGYAAGMTAYATGQIDVARALSGTPVSMINFNNSTTSATIGSITSTTSATNYATSSDYRLKENVQPMTGALSVVTALKPCTYTWKVDGSDGQGFIAHELQAVVPDAVVGEKDAIDAEGNPKYQGIDTSFLVATLTAAIQEQQALITTLTERITALEAK